MPSLDKFPIKTFSLESGKLFSTGIPLENITPMNREYLFVSTKE